MVNHESPGWIYHVTWFDTTSRDITKEVKKRTDTELSYNSRNTSCNWGSDPVTMVTMVTMVTTVTM